MLNLDPNIFNPSIFWEAWKTTQNFSQTMFNFFDMLNKNQKNKCSPDLLGELMQECMAYVSYNASIANKLFMSLSNIHNAEDLLKLQESVFIEYSEQNLAYIKKILTIYHELLQENYKNTKQHTEDFVHKCSKTSGEIVEKFNTNASKFAETMHACTAKNVNPKVVNNVNKKNPSTDNN